MNVHPIFSGYLRAVSGRPQRNAPDWFIMEEHRAILVRHLSAALSEIHASSRDFEIIDPDQYMVDLRAEFDPLGERSAIHDLFSDAFSAHKGKLKDAGLEPITCEQAAE